MIERKCLYFNAFGFQDGFRRLHLEGRVPDFEGQTVAVIAQEELEDGAKVHWRKDIQRGLTAFHAQGTQQAEDPEYMVPVNM